MGASSCSFVSGPPRTFGIRPVQSTQPWGAPKRAGAVALCFLNGATKKSPTDQGGVSGAGELGLGRGLRSEICSRGWERSSDRPCICRGLYDHLAHGHFVKISVKNSCEFKAYSHLID